MISMSSSTRARKSWKSKVSVDDKPCTNSVYLSSTPHRNAQVLIEPCHTRDSIAVVSHQLPQSSKNEVNELNDWPRLIARQKPSRFTKKKRKEKKREPGELHHTHRPLDNKRRALLQCTRENINGSSPRSCSIRNLTWQQYCAAKQYQGAIACVDT
jgi:hypothetical protein